MDSPVRVSEAAIKQPPSKMGFPIGTVLTVETALKILMVKVCQRYLGGAG